MKVIRYVLLGPFAIVLMLLGFLPGCTYLRLLAAAMLGGNIQ